MPTGIDPFPQLIGPAKRTESARMGEKIVSWAKGVMAGDETLWTTKAGLPVILYRKSKIAPVFSGAQQVVTIYHPSGTEGTMTETFVIFVGYVGTRTSFHDGDYTNKEEFNPSHTDAEPDELRTLLEQLRNGSPRSIVTGGTSDDNK